MSTATTVNRLPYRVLLASSDPALRRNVIHKAEQQRWSVVEASGGADALAKLEDIACRRLIIDRALPDLDTAEFIHLVESQYPGVEVFFGDDWFREEHAELSDSPPITTVPAHEPAEDYSGCERLPSMRGSSVPMQQLYRNVRLVAKHDTPVLICGETGTGKELVAASVHELSRRSSASFVTVNCAAIPEALLEAELFGYTKGAFTGAVQASIGRVHAAQGGTLFLDEIGEMPVSLQSKLLRFLENGEVQRLGSSDVFRVDVRIVAATNAALIEKVKRGDFRADLYYRLAVFPVVTPSLRIRKEDIAELASFFIEKLSQGFVRLSDGAIASLEHHDWPGNVRELKHVIERAFILADGANLITQREIVLDPVN